MADVVLPYTPATGATLDPDQLSRDFYSGTNAESLYHETNGAIETANMSAGFSVQPEHIRPGEAFRAGMDGMTEGLDYYDDTFGGNDVIGNYVPIAGCSKRVYLPFTSTIAVWQWSMFYTVHKERAGQGTALDSFLQVTMDGTLIAHTKRQLTQTMFVVNNGLNNFGSYMEATCTRHYDGVRMVQNQASGYHQLSLRVWLQPNDGTETLSWDRLMGIGTTKAFAQWTRLHCGIRNARVVAFR